MKQLFTICIAMLACSQLWAQHRILLVDGESIEKIRIHEIKAYSVVYEQDMSLHDIWIRQIDQIEMDSVLISFATDGTPIRVNKFEIVAEDSSEVEEKKWIPQPKNTINPGRTDDRLTIFATPSALLDILTTVQAGAEVRLSKKIAVLAEGGMVIDSWRNWSRSGNQLEVNGYVIRGAGRVYSRWIAEFFNIHAQTYIDGELFYKEAIANGNHYNYIQDKTEELETPILIRGLNIKLGVKKIYGNGFVIEAWLGGGSQVIMYDSHFLDSQTETYRTSKEVYSYPSITAGVKLGIAL